MRQADVNQVRKVLGNHVGQRVRVRANMGRHKFNVSEGVISQTYPSIFTITMDMGEGCSRDKTVSFSYTDVLTKNVQLTLCG